MRKATRTGWKDTAKTDFIVLAAEPLVYEPGRYSEVPETVLRSGVIEGISLPLKDTHQTPDASQHVVLEDEQVLKDTAAPQDPEGCRTLGQRCGTTNR
eukprot:Skav231950  [mRNA]  locus=scaffold459:199741:202082:- [translate_table: standard]